MSFASNRLQRDAGYFLVQVMIVAYLSQCAKKQHPILSLILNFLLIAYNIVYVTRKRANLTFLYLVLTRF